MASLTRLRFTTAQDLFDAFPTAREDIAAKPTEEPALDFLNALVARGELEDAVGFCAYLLPRREVVWWACACIRQSDTARTSDEEAALQAAEAWAQAPEEDRRLKALDRGLKGDRGKAATWAALAAGWSGGSFFKSDHVSAPPPPFTTAKSARAAVLFAADWVKPEIRQRKLRGSVDAAIRLLDGNEG